MWFKNAKEANKDYWDYCSNRRDSEHVFICFYSHSLAGILNSIIVGVYFCEVGIAEDEELGSRL